MHSTKNAVVSVAKAILPRRVRNAIFHFGFHLAPERFDEFAYQYAMAPNMRLGLLAAKSRGLNPKSIVDIGSFQGDWSLMAKEIWPEAKLIMVEANDEKLTKLQKVAGQLNAELHCALLGPTSGEEVDFYVMETGSSVMEEQSSIPRRRVRKRITSLDDLLSKVDSVDLIKIDTQGFELQVLKGAARLMATAEAILMEVSLIEINRGCPLIDEVTSFMKQKGFVTYDIIEIHRRLLDGATNQVDILFLRNNSVLRADSSFV